MASTKRWHAYNLHVVENTTGRSEFRTQFVTEDGYYPLQKIIDYYNENNYCIFSAEELDIYIPDDFDKLECFLEAEKYQYLEV